jgi:choline transport protein
MGTACIESIRTEEIAGPAHWAKVLGGERLGPVLGYLVGWGTNACWFFITAVSFLFTAQITIALVQVTNPSYSPPAWHTYVLYCALTVQGAAINLPKAHHAIDWAVKSMVVFVNGSAVFILVSLLVRAHPKPTAETVFVEVVNQTGWDSNLVVFCLNILPGLAAIGGLDSAIHLTDEVEEPGRLIPIAMLSSASLSYLVGVPSILAYLFSITNAQALLEPVGGQPLIQIFQDSYNFLALTIAASCCVIVVSTVTSWAALLSWNRLYWSFSRDGGLPCSRWTASVSCTDAIPVNALFVNTVLVLLVGLLQLWASTVLNAILGAASLCGAVSWIVPFVLLLWRGRTILDQRRWLHLGRLGYVVDWIAVLWMAWICVWTSFPLYVPITATTMNYASAVFGVVVGTSALFYVCSYRHRLNRSR